MSSLASLASVFSDIRPIPGQSAGASSTLPSPFPVCCRHWGECALFEEWSPMCSTPHAPVPVLLVVRLLDMGRRVGSTTLLLPCGRLAHYGWTS
ncbi:hypothetical protein CALVIDRAFT_437037 [Calocera viscosa TUFC12733]|uniref:Uncharacterized protein n=1 Tax=Calocera viscosa (strain TUFC12733) TaxID=1330018 RepID=A0A167FU07_CALVF|nr:hypothetical protein CALVIDRAFT_437037 [Calocera viscosa TUFC12733]